ncbi:hypothetical protein DUI87_14478 [Hirundo rustica rustica]|uniref:Uncharacterized protein n=1 Tax=Hirundo rustica rustica TaxID=333673 RepID=A0A3M0KLZ8_HIRRU|nr:hypothetical protein DUI87_14478 [Hirundo rustica rustica]
MKGHLSEASWLNVGPELPISSSPLTNISFLTQHLVFGPSADRIHRITAGISVFLPAVEDALQMPFLADANGDGEGQTALHYAATCEFLDIVELLLQWGADPRLRDQEGCLPEEVTDSKAITSALQRHGAGEP